VLSAPGAAARASAGGAPGATTRVDMDKIFPPGPGRDLVLNNCQNCHTFVPIVVLQMEEAAWTRSSVDHRPRVTGLSDAEFKTLYDYLKANFNPAHPVPVLPPELLNTWTGN
jgi:mono/diheme cytochrome c family protein